MFAEVETVYELNDSILVRVLAKDAFQQLCFNPSIVGLLFLILTYFNCYLATAVSHINAPHYLSESASINFLVYQVAVAKLLSHVSQVVAFLV